MTIQYYFGFHNSRWGNSSVLSQLSTTAFDLLLLQLCSVHKIASNLFYFILFLTGSFCALLQGLA